MGLPKSSTFRLLQHSLSSQFWPVSTPQKSYNFCPLFHCVFGQGRLFIQSLPIASHCSQLLHYNFGQDGAYSSKSPLKLPISSQFYIAILVRVVSSIFLSLQHHFIFQCCSEDSFSKFLRLQRTRTSQFWPREPYSSKDLPLRTIAAHLYDSNSPIADQSYFAFLVGGISSKLIPLARGLVPQSLHIEAQCNLVVHRIF